MPPSRPNSREWITEGSLLRALVRLAVPMLVGGILQNLQSMIDLFWVGRLGHIAVAAVAMSGTILMVLFPMLMGLSTGTVALVARAVGGGRMEEASRAASQSFLLAFILGGVSGALGWFFSPHLFSLLGASPEIISQGVLYLRIALLGVFTVFVLFIGNAALQGAGDTMTPMYVMAISNVLNMVLDPLFIFGLGPFPRMGVAGAAVATVLAQAVAAAVALTVLVTGRSHLHTHLRQWKPDRVLAWRILRIGLPGSGQMLSRSLMSAVLMRIVAGCGVAAVAAYGIGLRFHMIMLMPAFSLGGAAATLVGQNLGAERPDRARRSAWLAAVVDMALMAAGAALLMAFAPHLIGIFNRTPEVIRVGAEYLHTVSPFYIFAALGIILGRALNGAGDSLGPMIITILTLWGLQVPLAVVLSRIWPSPTQGIWWAIAIAMVANALLMTAWFRVGRWARMKV